MKKGKYFGYVELMVIVSFLLGMGWNFSKSWAAEGKYPYKPIQIIITYAPGTSDTVMRVFTERLQERLGQPMVFVFKPGAVGAIGASYVAKSKPDGYTLLSYSPGAVILNPLTKEGLDYTMDDFVPICHVASAPYILSVKGDCPWKTLKDMVEAAKKKPGEISFASAGVLSAPFIGVHLLMKSAGIDLNHIPTLGDVPSVTAALGGHVNMSVSTLVPVSPHYKSGALRPLVVFAKKRLKQFPDCPTATELGYPVVWDVGWGLEAPKGTPDEALKILCDGTEKVVLDHKEAIQDRLEKLLLTLEFLNSEDFGKELKARYERCKKIVEEFKQK